MHAKVVKFHLPSCPPLILVGYFLPISSSNTLIILIRSMASTAALLPQQQQQQPVVANSGTASNNVAGKSSGSIGPFFAVMSVLTILAIISCVLGRFCTRDGDVVRSSSASTGSSSLEKLKFRDQCYGWLKKRSHRSRSIVNLGQAEVGAIVMDLGEVRKDVDKGKDEDLGKVEGPPQPV